MGTATSFRQFSKNIKLRARKFTNNTERIIRSAAIAGSNEAISRTPFDTGRAKGNWVANIGSPVTTSFGVEGAGAGTAAQDGNRSVISKWKLGAGSIYLSNNLVYILPLDRGSSQQAPNGMSQFAVMAIKARLKKAKLLK